MVTKRKSESDTEDAKGKVKVSKLEVNKETVKDLTDSEKQKVQGGLRPRGASAQSCSPTCDGSFTCPG